MKEHGILMSTPMVEAYKRGNKFQTRRTTGLKEININPNNWNFKGFFQSGFNMISLFERKNSNIQEWIKLPYGFIGNVLYFKETWCYAGDNNVMDCRENYYTPIYKASEDGKLFEENYEGWRWKPSIFMPKAIARFKPTITNVRVERLQDISGKDVVAEGVEFQTYSVRDIGMPKIAYKIYRTNDTWDENPINAYWSLWEQINGKESWFKNPFVFIYDFTNEFASKTTTL